MLAATLKRHVEEEDTTKGNKRDGQKLIPFPLQEESLPWWNVFKFRFHCGKDIH